MQKKTKCWIDLFFLISDIDLKVQTNQVKLYFLRLDSIYFIFTYRKAAGWPGLNWPLSLIMFIFWYLVKRTAGIKAYFISIPGLQDCWNWFSCLDAFMVPVKLPVKGSTNPIRGSERGWKVISGQQLFLARSYRGPGSLFLRYSFIWASSPSSDPWSVLLFSEI